MDLSDPIEQQFVGPCSGRLRTGSPCVVAAGGDTQHSAHRPHRIHRLMHAHELECFGGTESVSCANQAAAFFKISHSTF